jgi:hypothetical protein
MGAESLIPSCVLYCWGSHPQSAVSIASLRTVLQGVTFSEFRIESRNNDVISLEIGIANLVHALKAGGSANFVTLKLTKKGSTPYLTIDVQVSYVPFSAAAWLNFGCFRTPV